MHHFAVLIRRKGAMQLSQSRYGEASPGPPLTPLPSKLPNGPSATSIRAAGAKGAKFEMEMRVFSHFPHVALAGT